jgi:hypothetical protein
MSDLRTVVRAAILTSLVVLGGWTGSAVGQGSPSPIPAFTGARVYVSGVPDRYEPVRDEIATLERSSPQTYYVVVVRSTGNGSRSTRPYLERMVDQWETTARTRGITFDKKRAVILLVALENRQIIVLGGEELQERLGFRDPYIERELIGPHFIAYAKAGDYTRGLRVLLGHIDRWITEHDKTLARRSAEAAAREERIRGDARSAVDATQRLLDETRKELAAKQAAGLHIDALELRVRGAAAELAAAEQRLGTSPSEALDLGQHAQRALVGVMDELRRSSLRQAESDQAIRKAGARTADVAKAIDQAGRAGLPTGAVQAELDAASAQLEQARHVLASEPEKAGALTASADRALQTALEHAGQLPELERQVIQKSTASATLAQSAWVELELVRHAGLPSKDLETRWDQASEALTTAALAAGTDPGRALAAFNEAEPLLEGLRQTAQGRLDRHRFLTRTLPLSVLGLVTLTGAGILGGLRYRRWRLGVRFERQFKGFREQAVGLMDRLDALRQRHKSLLATDPDYTQPLAGATLALYTDVENALNGLWEHWLRIMEVWDQAQRLVRAGSGLAAAKTEEAHVLIEKEGDFQSLLNTCNSCQERLDQLNQAHEKVRADAQAARGEVTALRQSLEAVAAAGLPADSSKSECTRVEGLLAQAEGLIAADPIGAGAAVAHSREALAALADRAGQLLARFQEATAALAAIDAVAARAAELRSQGVKLTEDETNPDPRLAEARRRQAAAIDALRRGDPNAAAAAIGEATGLTDQARQGIDRHLEARDTARRELPLRRTEAQRLEDSALKTETTLEELRQGFAPASWSDVADHLDTVHSLLRSIDERLAQVDEAVSDRVQDYLRSAATIAAAAHDQERVGQLLGAVADRHAALVALERDARQRFTGLEAELHRADAFFRDHSDAVSPEALQSLDQTAAVYQEVTGLLNARLPDWPEIRRRIDVASQGVATALKQAEDDFANYGRLLETLDRVRQKADAVGNLLRHEDKDRPPANQRYRAAVGELSAFENSAGDDRQWERGLRRLADIEELLERAEASAREDISLANSAIAEIAAAERTTREAHAYYESGITVDVTEAEDHLSRARGALATQAYEQAVEHAGAAAQAARRARESAGSEARRRRLQAERDRAFSVSDPAVLIAAAQAAAQAASNWASSGSSGSGGFSMPSPPSAPSFPDAGTPAGSWGAGSGGGNWTSGADQAGW